MSKGKRSNIPSFRFRINTPHLRHAANTMALTSIFGGSSAPSGKPAASSPADIKAQLKTQIAQELAVANATELVNKVTENCFEKCLNAPYANSQDNCVDQCLAKYMRSWNAISKAYIARIQQASVNGEI